jgi:hypothetical protein
MRRMVVVVSLMTAGLPLIALAQSATERSEPAGVASPGAPNAGPGLSTVVDAPVGHRQPTLRDVPKNESAEIDSMDKSDREFDRTLNICRGC